MESNQTPKKNACKRGIQRYIVNPSIQWRYTVAAVFGVFVISAFVSILLYGVLFDQARSRSLSGVTATATDTAFTIFTASIAFAVVPAIACGLWTIVMTHRLCGPIRVLETNLRELAGGRFPKHRPLRKRDNFRDVYEVFWQVVESLKTSGSDRLAELGGLRNTARRAIAKPGDARGTLESIASRLDDICRESAADLGINEPSMDEICSPPSPAPTSCQSEMTESVT